MTLVRLSGDEDGAHDQEKFAHHGAYGLHWTVISINHMLIHLCYVTVTTYGGHCWHIQRLAHVDRALLAHAGPLVNARSRCDVPGRKPVERMPLSIRQRRHAT